MRGELPLLWGCKNKWVIALEKDEKGISEEEMEYKPLYFRKIEAYTAKIYKNIKVCGNCYQ